MRTCARVHVQTYSRAYTRTEINYKVYSDNGQTALMYAASSGNEQMVIALLDAKANVNLLSRKTSDPKKKHLGRRTRGDRYVMEMHRKPRFLTVRMTHARSRAHAYVRARIEL